MSVNIKDATQEYATRLGDDAVVLGHRISEWVSRGPFLEEDIAYANVALDYIGRARMFYGYACLLYTSPSPRDRTRSRMPSSA